MRLISIFLFLAVFANCTKTEKAAPPKPTPVKKEKIVNYQSPMNFVYSEELADNDLAFKVGNLEYPLSQLFRTNKSLARLVTENKKIWFVSAYRRALSLKDKQATTIPVSLPFPQGDLDMDSLLLNSNIEADPVIRVTFAEKESANGPTLINNKKYSQTELAQYSLDHSRSLQKIFNLAMKRIETRLSRMLITQAAKEKQQTFSEFVDENGPSSGGVTEVQVKEFAQQNSIPEQDLNEKMTKTIREIIKSKNQNANFVSLAKELLDNQPVSVALHRPYYKVDSVELPEDTPAMGSGKVNVTLISNFLCKRCAPIEEKLTELFGKTQDSIQVSYLFRIRPEERMSKFVAEASLCIHKMNPSQFWDLHQASLKSDFIGNEKTINAFVESNGLTVEEMRQCLSSLESNKILKSQLEITSSMESLTLPIVAVNGHIFENPKSIAPIEELINYEFKHHKEEPKQKITSNKKGWFSWLKSLFS